jgi:Transmembrane secretion effector
VLPKRATKKSMKNSDLGGEIAVRRIEREDRQLGRRQVRQHYGSARVALPAWVRGRGLAMFATVQFGAMSLGSVVWGQVATLAGPPIAHVAAAAGALIAIPLLWRWKLQTGESVDMTPSMHWPAPILSHDVDGDRGPVLTTLEDRVNADDRDAFLEAIKLLAQQRRRDGAYGWAIFEDVSNRGRFVETF